MEAAVKAEIVVGCTLIILLTQQHHLYIFAGNDFSLLPSFFS